MIKLLIMGFFSLPPIISANIADTKVHNISSDKNLSHKALGENVSKDFRNESKAMREELKNYRNKIYNLKQNRESALEAARALVNEAKATKKRLEELTLRRKKLRERLSGVSSEVASLASSLLLGGDLTDRERIKKEEATLTHAIQELSRTRRKAIARAKELVKKRKIWKAEIAELREEMTHLKRERILFLKRGLAHK